ncbi:hypothetical protein [Nocardia sp. NPDC050435]|uniref:hypothetical protein n=1 Tax=Nocardia sp. NPDC050435 TaxID=3155040 RepID=UPI0033C22045
MSGTPKLDPPEWPKHLAMGAGMLAMLALTPLVFDPHATPDPDAPIGGTLGNSPLDRLIDLGVTVKTTALAWVPVVLIAVAGAAALAGILLLSARQGRTLAHFTLRAWWTYRRRWATVLDEHGLLVKHGKRIRVPKLGKIRALDAMDVMQVHMPQGQDLDDWAQAAQPLALAFGASAGFVQPDTTRNPYRDIVVAFARDGGDHLTPRALPSASELAVPAIPGYTRRPVTIRLTAWAVILGWGSLRIDDGQTIRNVRIWGRRWNQCLVIPAS